MNSRDLDQFFTNSETVKKCLIFLASFYSLDKFNWIEPSAGKGAFILGARQTNLKAPIATYDLFPQYENVIKADFLNVDIKKDFKGFNNKLLLGNPPFGKNSSLAIKFFNHAAKEVDVIAMIFPATFSKQSIKNKLNLNFSLKGELDLGFVDFHFMNELRSVPVVFQIWEKSTKKREVKKEKLQTLHFEFVKKEEANFAIQRVGAAAGKVKDDFTNVSPNSHYFIRAKNDLVKNVFLKINWDSVKYKTAGNPSIAKTELIRIFEENYLIN